MRPKFGKNVLIVPSGSDGRPDPLPELIKEVSIYLTKNVQDVFDEWIFDSGNSEFVKIGNTTVQFDDETNLRKERVENVRKYFDVRRRTHKFSGEEK